MKKTLAVAALAVFAFAPAIGAACEYVDDSSASATPPVQWGLTAAPAATKVPAPAVAKVRAPNAVRQVKAKVPASDQKVAAGTTN